MICARVIAIHDAGILYVFLCAILGDTLQKYQIIHASH